MTSGVVLELDDYDTEDIGRAMALLRGWKTRRNEPMRKHLEALETLCRRCASLSVVERAAVDERAAKVEDRAMQIPLWMTTKQTAETLQISEGLVRKRIREGDIHAVREGRGFRIRRTELERYVDEKEAGTNE